MRETGSGVLLNNILQLRSSISNRKCLKHPSVDNLGVLSRFGCKVGNSVREFKKAKLYKIVEEMEQDDDVINKLQLPPRPCSMIVGMAIRGNNKKGRLVVRWAVDKFAGDKNVIFKLIHVRPPITDIPKPMGALVVMSRKQGMTKQTNAMLSPYKAFLLQNKVQFEVGLVESDDVVRAIANQVATDSITNLVIGASSSSAFSRLLSSKNLSAKISECTPSYCTVYVISKGSLVMVRSSSSECNAPIIKIKDRDSGSETSSNHSSSTISLSLPKDPWTGTASYHSPSPSMRMQKSHMKSDTLSNHFDRHKEVCSGSNTPTNSVVSSRTNGHVKFDQYSFSEVSMNLELERLRKELRQVQGMYVVTQTEALDTSRKIMLREIEDEEIRAEEVAREERMKYEAVVREAESFREQAIKEAEHKREAAKKALLHDAKQKEKLQNVAQPNDQQYQTFTWEEINEATSSFAEHLIVGKGANGTVYKCTVQHTTAAAKVLHSNDPRMKKQFQKELEVLSKIHHPHLLLLLGACPERGCIIYEYMDNGNLDERLNCKNNKPPIPWFDRFRIAWEMASTLVFLHNAKPKPIVHRDLKPENILLDHNLVSKIGDVGLSTILQNEASFVATMYKNTGLAGTLCYIDPEYQRTGVISTQSDVYAFGMVLLQLLTAKSAMALAHIVENAIRDGKLIDVLDTRAGKWPMAETTELAMLALSCVELYRRDRPDLRNQIFPKLEILKEAADSIRDASLSLQSGPPSHFFCPILQKVMTEPCVAADGYTYDRNAIEKWLEKKENSPMTNLPMSSKNLIPNYTLLSAIMEWKSRST